MRHLLKPFVQRTRYAVRCLLGRDVFQRRQVVHPVERHGSDYGGWTLLAGSLQADSIVYSFGLGDDISFDLALIEKYGLTLHAFDPTPRSVAWIQRQHLPEGFLFNNVGLASYDGMASFRAPTNACHVSYAMIEAAIEASETITAPVRQLATLMQERGHNRIDLLKMDIEGAEYAVLAIEFSTSRQQGRNMPLFTCDEQERP